MLTLYICDSCHYLFSPPDREESRVERCPGCGKESVVVQAQVGGTIVSLVRPAVRPVSEDERADYLNVKAELKASAKKESSYRKLQESVKTYNMTMNEHNFALILIYYLRDSTPESKRLMLDRFLHPEHWHDQNPDEYVERDYKDIRRKFWSKVNQERHAVRDESASLGPALECLNAFSSRMRVNCGLFCVLPPLGTSEGSICIGLQLSRVRAICNSSPIGIIVPNNLRAAVFTLHFLLCLGSPIE